MNAINRSLSTMWIVLTFSALVAVSACSGVQKKTGQDNIRIQVEELLNQVQAALITVQDTADSDKLPKLDSVTLKLSAQFVTKGSGKVDLYVLSFGTEISEAATQSISLKLTPPEPGTPKPSSADDISKPLANAILSAARGAAKAKKTKPILNLTELTASFKFVVDTSGSGGVKFTIVPVTVEIGGKVSKAATQEIIVTFK